MRTQQDRSIYFEATTFKLGIPIAGSAIETAMVASAQKDMQSKKKFYEKKLGVPIDIVSEK